MTTAPLVILFILYTLSMLFLGFLLGVALTISYVSREMNKAHHELEKYFGSGEEWKEGEKIDSEDENWLRRRLGEDKDKGEK